ncbi:MAG: hypothetical protein U1E26_02195 [Coriobacteriia bacterium]|nr:hypothetical protein [Coriobacteriia bacterium]
MASGHSGWGESRIQAITSRVHWRGYALGIATEVLFVLALTGVGFALAVIAMVLWG